MESKRWRCSDEVREVRKRGIVRREEMGSKDIVFNREQATLY